MKPFYPLRRRHTISRPRTAPVTRVFEFDTSRFTIVTQDLVQLATLLCPTMPSKRMETIWHDVPQMLWQAIHNILVSRGTPAEVPDPGNPHVVRVTITTPPRISPKLKAYFNLP